LSKVATAKGKSAKGSYSNSAIWRQIWRHLAPDGARWKDLAVPTAIWRQMAQITRQIWRHLAPYGAIWRHLLALLAPDGFSFLVPTAIWRHPKNPSDLAPSGARSGARKMSEKWRQMAPDGASWSCRHLAPDGAIWR